MNTILHSLYTEYVIEKVFQMKFFLVLFLLSTLKVGFGQYVSGGEDKSPVYTYFEGSNGPFFSGCEKESDQLYCLSLKINQFTSENYQFPPLAKELNVQGKIIASFVIEKDSTVSDVKITHTIKVIEDSLSTDSLTAQKLVAIRLCEEELIRVISILPRIGPAIIHNKPVRMRMSLPLHLR